MVPIYLLSIVLANLGVARFGPSAAIVVAFMLIGLDLTARDALHHQWSGRHLWRNMAILILSGSALSYIVNRESGSIALASALAFMSAAVVDTLIYSLLQTRPVIWRINISNIFSAAVDSLIFPLVAFGGIMPAIIFGQFIAKTCGGFIWGVALAPLNIWRNPNR